MRNPDTLTESLAALIAALAHTNHNVRGRAAVELGATEDPRGTDALVQALGNERDFFVREYLTWALVRMGDGPVAPLMEMLRDPNSRARHAAVHALSKIGDPRAVGALITALHDADLSVVTKAAYALGELRNVAALPPLVNLLGRQERELQATLVLAFENFGPAALAPLLQALDHDSWRVREQAGSILGVLGQADAKPALVPLLKDPHWQVRFACAHAIGTLGGAEAMQAAQLLSSDPDARVRALASRLESLG